MALFDPIVRDLLSVAVGTPLATLLASGLIYAFTLFGRRFSLDEPIFPTVTAS